MGDFKSEKLAEKLHPRSIAHDGSSRGSSRRSGDLGERWFIPPPALPKRKDLIGTVHVRSSVQFAKERRTLGSTLPEGLVGETTIEDPDEEALRTEFMLSRKYDWSIDPKKIIIKKFIAKGTFGTVHRGSYNGRDVAVKLLDWGEESANNRAHLTELRRAFIQEVTVWSRLKHENVTEFIGAVVGGEAGFQLPTSAKAGDGHMLVDGHVCCVVLEYLPGGTLKQYIAKNSSKKLPLKRVVQLALGVARGLAYLHEKHIVHRDIKPDNMLLDRKMQAIKIADFGVSRVENDKKKSLHRMAGTYGYMAPEVLLGTPYDHKVDVYSFGILLWEIYCCDDPFPFYQFNPRDIKSFVSQGLRPEVPACCPSSLRDIMTRCWDRDPEKRPNMVEVVSVLETYEVKKNDKGMTPKDKLPQPGCACFGMRM